MNVLLFRTNINTDQRVHRAACRLCKLRGICHWSIDLEDCVLRVETELLQEADIIRLLMRAGLQCSTVS